MKNNIVAVIDVGTLKSKFEIKKFDAKLKSKTLYRDKKLTVMGRDLDKTGNMITEKSIILAIETLNEFSQKMTEFKVSSYRAVATEAIRRAMNSEEVLSQIKAETGIYLDTLSHKDEAEMLFRSISIDFPGQVIAVSDIGGGSVQVVVGKDNEIFETYLFKTGTYYLQEEFSKTHHPSAQELANTRKYIKKELRPLANSKYKPEVLIYGTTNIIDFLKVMDVNMSTRPESDSHPYSVIVHDLFPTYDKIIGLSYEDRMPLYPDEPYYMWSADKALMNIFQICEYLKTEKIVPTNHNISTAMLYDLAVTINEEKLKK
jgi:exopolyphosphatase/guanosine-5'-triphosphate,3'-diphosphate pyrophosphatase